MTKQNNGWISIDERLPEEGKDVLIYVPGFDTSPIIDIAWLDNGANGALCLVGSQYGFDIEDVTHWQPLPQPPEDKEPQAESTSHEKKPIPLIRDRFIVPCMILSWNKI